MVHFLNSKHYSFLLILGSALHASIVTNGYANEELCTISFTEAAGMVEVMAITKQAINVNLHNYSITIESISQGGRSSSLQSGKVNFPNGINEIVLSRSVINANHNSSLSAVLSIKDASGTEICRVHKKYGLSSEELIVPEKETKI